MKFYNIQTKKVNPIGLIIGVGSYSSSVLCLALLVLLAIYASISAFTILSDDAVLMLPTIHCKYNTKQSFCSTFDDYLACHFKLSVPYLYALK